MDAIIVIAIVLGSLAMLVAVAFPVWIAWVVAWRSRMEPSIRRSFLLACLLLSYGVLTLTGAALVPVEIASMYMAPTMDAAGYEWSAKAIWAASRWIPIACFIAGVVASFVFPMALRHRWQAIASALRDGPARAGRSR